MRHQGELPVSDASLPAAKTMLRARWAIGRASRSRTRLSQCAAFNYLAPGRTQTRNTRLQCDRLGPSVSGESNRLGTLSTRHTGGGLCALRVAGSRPLGKACAESDSAARLRSGPARKKSVHSHTWTPERGCCTTKHNTSTYTRTVAHPQATRAQRVSVPRECPCVLQPPHSNTWIKQAVSQGRFVRCVHRPSDGWR